MYIQAIGINESMADAPEVSADTCTSGSMSPVVSGFAYARAVKSVAASEARGPVELGVRA